MLSTIQLLERAGSDASLRYQSADDISHYFASKGDEVLSSAAASSDPRGAIAVLFSGEGNREPQVGYFAFVDDAGAVS
jgi:hypothetical protein